MIDNKGWQYAWLNERCPRPHCGGNLFLERDGFDKLIKKCFLCARSWYLDDTSTERMGGKHIGQPHFRKMKI